MDVVLAIVAIGVLIFVHEMGHFLASRAVGVPVQEFALGFGPALWRFQGKETTYRLNLVPLGGYVRFYEVPEAGTSLEDILAPAVPAATFHPDPRRYFTARLVWEKAVITVAGVVCNFLLAIVIFAMVGSPGVSNHAYVVKVMPSGLAARATIKAGDEIIKINGREVATPQRVVEMIRQSPRQVTIQVKRSGQILDFQSYKAKPSELLGILVGQVMVFQRAGNPALDLFYGFRQTWVLSGQILGGLYQLVSGQTNLNQISGPVGVVQVTASVAKQGFAFLAYFVAILSIQLGIINLLPIPGLDGGHLFFLGIEAIKGRALDQTRVGWINLMGFLLLVTFMLMITFRDIAKLFKLSG